MNAQVTMATHVTLPELQGFLSALLCFRTFPFVVFAGLSPKVRPATKCLCFLFYAVASVLAWRSGYLDVTDDVVRAYAFFLVFAVATYVASERGHRRGAWLRLSFFFVSALCCLGVPATGVLGSPAVGMTVGWEVMFSAYSFFVHGTPPRRRASLSDALFFILVNPALVYPRRGRAIEPGHYGQSGCRIALGIAALAAGAAVLPGWLPWPSATELTYPRVVVAGALSFATLYAGHAGVASVQIGLCCLVGWKPPERYRRPFLARSPSDFWRRWNIYLGCWLRLYLYLPLARRSARWVGSVVPRSILAVCGTFGFVGVLHDLAAAGQSGHFTVAYTLLFGACAALVAAGHALAPALKTWRRKLRRYVSQRLSLALGILQWAVAVHVIFVLSAMVR